MILLKFSKLFLFLHDFSKSFELCEILSLFLVLYFSFTGKNKRDCDSKMSSIGPQIPDNHPTHSKDDESDSDDDFMPQLPPDLLASYNSNNDCRFVDEKDEDAGDDDKPPDDEKDEDDDDDDDDESEEDDEDDVIGPLPPTAEDERRAKLSVAQEFESRNKKMKDKLTGKQDKAPEREAWMTELPDLVRKNFGLVARGFRKDAGPSSEGRTEWTETPADREKRRQEAAERGKRREERGGDDSHNNDSDEGSSSSKKKKKKKSKKHKREKEREDKIREGVDKYNEKKRGESLLELHRKKLEKKKEKEKKKKGDKPAERVPFSREKDLEVNKFDDAKRNRLIKASAQLNTRFSHGATTSSFL